MGSAGRATGPEAGGLSEEGSAWGRERKGMGWAGGWSRPAGSGPGRDRPPRPHPSPLLLLRVPGPPAALPLTNGPDGWHLGSPDRSFPGPTPPRDWGGPARGSPAAPSPTPRPLHPPGAAGPRADGRRGVSVRLRQAPTQGLALRPPQGSPQGRPREPGSEDARLRGGPRGPSCAGGGAAPSRRRATPPHVGASRARGV